jgi:hypothetical protein
MHSFGSNVFFHLRRHLNSPKQAKGIPSCHHAHCHHVLPPCINTMHRSLFSFFRSKVVQAVAQRVEEYGAGVVRLFKLLCISQFSTGCYANRSLIARGAYGIVYGFDYRSDSKSSSDGSVKPVAAKLMSVPQDNHHRFRHTHTPTRTLTRTHAHTHAQPPQVHAKRCLLRDQHSRDAAGVSLCVSPPRLRCVGRQLLDST